MNVVLLGPPGAGKGTQAGVLCQRFKVLHVSTGDMLREAVKNGSEIGLKAKSYMDKGGLVPDDVVIKIVAEKLLSLKDESGFLLDGFPRTVKQADELDKSLESSGKKLDLILYFKTSQEISISRLSGRRVCKKCGRNYHVKNMKPKKEGVCDSCGENLYQRNDDKEETVKKRLFVYGQDTKPLIEYYKKRGILEEMQGDLNVEELFTKVKELFVEKKLI